MRSSDQRDINIDVCMLQKKNMDLSARQERRIQTELKEWNSLLTTYDLISNYKVRKKLDEIVWDKNATRMVWK